MCGKSIQFYVKFLMVVLSLSLRKKGVFKDCRTWNKKMKIFIYSKLVFRISRVTSIKFIYLHIDLSLRTELFKDGHNHIIQKLYNAKKMIKEQFFVIIVNLAICYHKQIFKGFLLPKSVWILLMPLFISNGPCVHQNCKNQQNLHCHILSVGVYLLVYY